MTRLIFENTQRVTFDCSHFFKDRQGRPEYERVHGHSYFCEVTITGYQSHEAGWLIDYATFRGAIEQVTEQLDHRTLNDIEGLETPTMENIAVWIINKLQRWLAVSGFQSRALKITKVTIERPNIGQSCTYHPIDKETN